jgi:ABC-type branched-subunit amino acid transport system substrate-binding protein
VEAVVAAVMPEDGVELVRRIREIDTDVIIIGSPFFGRRLFLEKVGNSGEGIVLPYPGRIHTEKDTLETHFRQEWNRVPDFAARQTYDSVRFLAEAIRKTGLNRARIRDEIRCMAPWNGTIGIIDWDPIGQNNRPVTLARITNGMIQPLLEQ